MALIRSSWRSGATLEFPCGESCQIRWEIEIKQQLESVEVDFCTLAKANFLRAASSISTSCRGLCTRVINDQLSIIVCLDGIIDIEAELGRLDKDKNRLSLQIEQCTKRCKAHDYETKVPESVRKSNSEKMESLNRELDEVINAMNTFLVMREMNEAR